MASRYFIFVIDDLSGSGTPEEMVAIDAFNDQLRANNQLIALGGLAAPKHSTVIDNRNGAGVETGAPLFSNPEQFSGFWLITADSDETAKRLAFDGSKACNRRVEIRPLL